MKVIVNKTCANVSGIEQLTSGMVGKTIDVEFSADWVGLTKIAVFTNGETTRDVLDPNGSVVIPWEVLVKPNKRASVGFYGYHIENGEKVLAIPTIWAELGAIRAGADPSGDPSNPPSPEVAEQILAIIGDLENLDTEDKENLVAAINEAYNHGGGGGGTSDYDDLDNKPQINGVELSGNKTTEQLGIEIPSLDGYATEQWVEGKGYAAASDVEAIEIKIPSAASAENQLADKAFVNSTVGTNTAYYISNNGQPFTSLAQLEAYSGTVTNNDYAFVVGTDSAGNTTYTRYKYNASTEAWAAEYVLNNSSFTAVQWAAINSGITSGDVALISTALQPSALNAYRTAAAQDVIDGGKLDASEIKLDPNDRVYKIGSNFIAAEYDGNGAIISSTYAKKTELDDYALKTDLTQKQDTALTATVTISVADWDSGTTVTKNVTGVTASNIVICDSSDADVQCTAQGAGTLTFTASATPSAEVTVKVVILP